ncbi:MAG: hypothetical protein WDA71_05815 [Actinomycetota bacterium]
MSTATAPGHKFACIALENVSVTSLNAPIQLQGGLEIHSDPPFAIGSRWIKRLGTLNTEHLKGSNFAILATAPSARLEVLDKENETLEQAALGFFYALLMQGVPHMDGGLILSGANVGGDPNVRSVTVLGNYYRPAHVLPLRIDARTIASASTVAAGLRSIYEAPDAFSRLKRGVHAWYRGVREERANDRVHQFVRAIEAMLKPAAGRTRRQFVHRCQVFAGTSQQVGGLLGELFDLRSCAEHLHDWDCGLEAIPEQDRERHGSLRAYQAELLAGLAYSRLLSNPSLLGNFQDDASIEALWRRPLPAIQTMWGQASDLDALASKRFRFRRPQP